MVEVTAVAEVTAMEMATMVAGIMGGEASAAEITAKVEIMVAEITVVTTAVEILEEVIVEVVGTLEDQEEMGLAMARVVQLVEGMARVVE
jgi:hypothetical protein